ncbi:uncharacterized protein AB675_1801 [Cyphellophora attinorum]|uniref:Uncharacterized protein n=1 Tax=Cyphellophora attinorum TaxID=1664694 RepID=A0A0N0NPF8_9EURO|nr:uncharacterized protein AB675_1801 [Phialophora attinorum]KPI42701.1 hypothetical protein AB675_1801 [Phialophora attinorum]
MKLAHSSQRCWTGGPLRINYLDSSTFEDYLDRCKGLYYVADFLVNVELGDNDNGYQHILWQYKAFFIENYVISLEICRKLLCYLQIESPSLAILRNLPRTVIGGLCRISWALNWSAGVLGDETGLTRHEPFWDVTSEVWEQREQRDGDASDEQDATYNVSRTLSTTAITVVKQLLGSCDGRIGGTYSYGRTVEWYVDEEGDVVLHRRFPDVCSDIGSDESHAEHDGALGSLEDFESEGVLDEVSDELLPDVAGAFVTAANIPEEADRGNGAALALCVTDTGFEFGGDSMEVDHLGADAFISTAVYDALACFEGSDFCSPLSLQHDVPADEVR